MTSKIVVNNIEADAGVSTVTVIGDCQATTFKGDGSNLTSLPAQATIANNADNRVVTGGSGVNLNGEANLTFNGGATGDAQLTVHAEQNDSGADSELILETSNDFTTSVVMFKDSTAEAGSIAYNHGDNYIKLSTNGTNGGTERVRIDSAGRVGIKNTNMSSFNDGMDDLVIGNGASNTSPGLTIFSHATDIGTISFRDIADTGISGLIQYRHLESPPYMRFMVEGTQRMSITTHGGIAFNSDTAAANTLDDYEEGSWTPAFGNVNTPTYGTQYGRYCKIGSQVTLTGQISVDSGLDTSDGSTVNIGGLPFGGNSAAESCLFTFGRYTNLLSDSKLDDFTNVRFIGTAVLLLEGNNADISYAECNSSGTLQFAISYIINT